MHFQHENILYSDVFFPLQILYTTKIAENYISRMAIPHSGRVPPRRVALTYAARGVVDRDIPDLIDEIIAKGCTELDLSENLITQRGASLLANLLLINKVHKKYHQQDVIFCI